MEPMAAPAANNTPWSRARKNATGPDVSGNPTSQPLTPGPHLRPAMLTAPINVGVSTSLSARPSTTPSLSRRGRRQELLRERGGSARLSAGYREGERGALPFFRFAPDAAAELLDDEPHQVEA